MRPAFSKSNDTLTTQYRAYAMSTHPYSGVVQELLSLNHGWWCDYIINKATKQGTLVPKLSGKQRYVDPSLYRLYGYQDHPSEFSFENNVHREDQEKLILAGKETIRPGAAARSERVNIKTARGDYKLVQVYFRRLELNGKPVLASLHSDLAVSDDLRWVDQTILDAIPAYIFIKRWDEVKKKFIFRHVNKRLALALGEDNPRDVVGNSDEEYFRDSYQRNAYFEADKEVYDSRKRGFQVVREEAFAPERAPVDGTGEIRRIVTVKTPYWCASDALPARGEWQVLGIAFDVTPVTRILRALADESNDAIYIKDSKHRYQVVNKVFMRMMGLNNEAALLHRTFLEAFRDRLPEKLLDGSDPGELIDQILQEDIRVLEGQEINHVRLPISATTMDPWLTMKKRIGTGKGQQKYILGISKSLIRDSFVQQTPLRSSADRVPQAISIKLYCPELPSERQFQLVWGNRTFLERHGKRDVQDIIGKTDYDLWDQKQAFGYQRVDRLALSVTQKLQKECEDNGRNLEDCWEELRKRLDQAECWEFRERQQRNGRQAFLQTTKWAQFIGQRWFVFVVYSDVTKAEDERLLYHRMTVHTIRNGFFAASVTRYHLEQFLEHTRNEPTLDKALRCLLDTSENIERTLEHHMELVHMEPKLQSLELEKLEKEVKRLVAREDRIAEVEEGRVLFRVEPTFDRHCRVNMDVMFLVMILAELLRNAQKSVKRARWNDNHCTDATGASALADQGWVLPSGVYVPKIEVVFGSAHDTFALSVIDNGDACRGRKARKELRDQYDRAVGRSITGGDKQLGVAFCSLVVAMHGGQLDLESNDDRTVFSITLPLL